MSRAPSPPALVVSAYAASPAHALWDPELEGELLPALAALPGVVGLEVPWLGAPHPHDDEWFYRNVPPGIGLWVTPLPWVMQRCARLPGYGLASRDEDGRRAALSDLHEVSRDIARLHERCAVHVAAVLLHTAPRGGGDQDALRRSLDEVAVWDLQGTQLILEHCDAAVPGQAWEKGFLSTEAELAASADSTIRMALNWGRSLVELRDPDAVTEQIARVAASGRLSGLTFSGAAAVASSYGSAWEDRHLPLASTDPDAHSLLSDARVEAALRAAGELDTLGLKVSRRPADQTAADVVRTVAANLDAVRAAWTRARSTGLPA